MPRYFAKFSEVYNKFLLIIRENLWTSLILREVDTENQIQFRINLSSLKNRKNIEVKWVQTIGDFYLSQEKCLENKKNSEVWHFLFNSEKKSDSFEKVRNVR